MLTELLTELDRLDQPSREMLLSSLKEPDGAALVVSSAWLAEGRKATLSKDRGQQVAAEFLRLSFIAEKWSSTDLAVELVCAQVVMLDEYIHQTAEALAAVRAAQDRFPTDLRLARRRHMIYYGWAIIAPRSMPSETSQNMLRAWAISTPPSFYAELV